MFKNSENPVAIVTGGSKGIGAGIVKILAENNFNVVLNYFHSEECAKQVMDLFPDNIVCYKADVSDYSQVKSLIDFSIGLSGRVDLLVNNAGIDLYKAFDETSFEDFDRLMKTNLYSSFFASREVSKIMIKQKSGLIVNISSIWGVTGGSYEVAYSVSKAGLDGLTKSLAKELGPSNIRVNSIAPGVIDTDMISSFSESDISNLKDEIPLGRIGSVDDVANAVLDLYNSNYITGQILQVNGGWNI